MGKDAYTSYERLKAALEFKEADRIPFDIGASHVTAISKQSYAQLRQHLGLPEREIVTLDKTLQIAQVDDDFVSALNIDMQNIDPDEPANPGLSVSDYIEDGYHKYTDIHGITWRMPVKNGQYYDSLNYPLADAEEPEALDEYPWFDMSDCKLYAGMNARAKKIAEGKRAPLLNFPGGGVMEFACNLIGYEKFYCDMIVNKPFIHELMRRCTEQRKVYWKAALEQVGENVLICAENDDLGTQRSPFFSTELYREMIHPYHKELFSFIKKEAKTDVYIALHSCGAVRPLIPLFIEEGVDILNPVQVNATGMDTAELKKEFGKELRFWGGGVDTQFVLPFGTEQQVRDEVERRINDLAPGGGFIFSQVHNILSYVPLKNIVAMLQAYQDFCKY